MAQASARVAVHVSDFPEVKRMAADLALALKLLDECTLGDGPCARFGAGDTCETHEMWDLDPNGPCPGAEAHELLVRHGIREA